MKTEDRIKKLIKYGRKYFLKKLKENNADVYDVKVEIFDNNDFQVKLVIENLTTGGQLYQVGRGKTLNAALTELEKYKKNINNQIFGKGEQIKYLEQLAQKHLGISAKELYKKLKSGEYHGSILEAEFQMHEGILSNKDKKKLGLSIQK